MKALQTIQPEKSLGLIVCNDKPPVNKLDVGVSHEYWLGVECGRQDSKRIVTID